MSRSGQTEAHLRQALCDRARMLYQRGLITSLDGNLSARFEGRWILATPAMHDKSSLKPADIVLLDLGFEAARGGAIDREPAVARARRGVRPSSEMAMHMAVYAARPDVQAVVHAHPPTAVGLTLATPRPRLDICPEAVVFLGDVGYAEYATPGTEDLAASLGPLLGRCDVMLLVRHGAVTVGGDLEQAYQRMEVLEHVARIYLAARQLGPVTSIPDDEKRRLRGDVSPPDDPTSEADRAAIVRAVLARLGRP